METEKETEKETETEMGKKFEANLWHVVTIRDSCN